MIGKIQVVVQSTILWCKAIEMNILSVTIKTTDIYFHQKWNKLLSIQKKLLLTKWQPHEITFHN